MKSILLPTRPGDAVMIRSATAQKHEKHSMEFSVLSIYPRLLRRDHMEHKQIGHKPGYLRVLARLFDSRYGLLEAAGYSAVLN